MIPRAIDMIFSVSGQLKDRGWKYQMEGQFLEVYNEVVSCILSFLALSTCASDRKVSRLTPSKKRTTQPENDCESYPPKVSRWIGRSGTWS